VFHVQTAAADESPPFFFFFLALIACLPPPPPPPESGSLPRLEASGVYQVYMWLMQRQQRRPTFGISKNTNIFLYSIDFWALASSSSWLLLLLLPHPKDHLFLIFLCIY
jgi:hypothetical protein